MKTLLVLFGWILAVVLVTVLCASRALGETSMPNYIFLVLDDVGGDRASWTGGENAPATPFLQSLSERSINFPHFYTMPTCAPTRASALTGRLPRHHGIASSGWHRQNGPLAPDLPNLFHVFRIAGYATAAFGKWHLGDHHTHPLDCGVSEYELTQRNLDDYYNFRTYSELGSTVFVTQYATDWLVDEARHFIARATAPWCMWLAPHVAHKPFHVPPGGSGTTPEEQWAEALTYLDAALLSLWRLSQDAQWIVFSDNGSPHEVAAVPEDQGKGTVGQGGIQSHLIWSGPHLEYRQVRERLSVVDLLPTIQEAVGVDLPQPAIDGRSFYRHVRLSDGGEVLHRPVVAERFLPNGRGIQRTIGEVAVVIGQYKLRIFFDTEGFTSTYHDIQLAPHRQDGPPIAESDIPDNIVSALWWAADLEGLPR